MELVSAEGSGSAFDLVFAFCGGSECDWDCDFDFVEVGDVVDERELVSCVDESDCRGVACCDDCGVGDSVEA